MNYFELFEIPITPKVDLYKITKKYFELQRSNHPDFFSDATESEKEAAIQLSAEVNKGYTIFKDKQSTLEYYLKTKGIIREDEKFDLPADFLMEMMDLNEEFNDLDHKEIRNKIMQYENNLYNSIKDFIELNESEFDEKHNFELMMYFYKKKYLNRILDRLED